MNQIQKRFMEILVKKKVKKACQKLNMNFYDIFLKDLESKNNNPYEEYMWEVKKSSKVGTAINAVPPIEMINILPWEEWFIYEGKICHYILYTKKKDKCIDIWKGESFDKDHPKTVLNRKWYYYNNYNLKPLFLQ